MILILNARTIVLHANLDKFVLLYGADFDNADVFVVVFNGVVN